MDWYQFVGDIVNGSKSAENGAFAVLYFKITIK